MGEVRNRGARWRRRRRWDGSTGPSRQATDIPKSCRVQFGPCPRVAAAAGGTSASAIRRYLAPDLNGRIGGRGRKNRRQMHHADEGAATPVATEGRGRGYGNSANRGKQALESTTRASPPPQSPRYLTHRNFLPLSLLSHTVILLLSQKLTITRQNLSPSTLLHSFILSARRRVCPRSDQVDAISKFERRH